MITRNNDDYITFIKRELMSFFDMKNLGLLHYYLGIEVDQKPKYIFISQKKKILDNYWTYLGCRIVTLFLLL